MIVYSNYILKNACCVLHEERNGVSYISFVQVKPGSIFLKLRSAAKFSNYICDKAVLHFYI